MPDFSSLAMRGSGTGSSGHGPFGRPLGPIPLPDPYGDIQRAGVNVGAINPAASAALLAGFQGQLAPGTQNAIQDASASWSASSGMPGFSPGSLGFNRGLRDLGLTAEGVKNQAFANYGQLLNPVSQTQTVNPALQYERSLQNETNAASPDHAQAQSYAESLFAKYLQSLKGSATAYQPQNAHGSASSMKSGYQFYNPVSGNPFGGFNF